MLSITVRNKRFNCDICLEHKVSIFTGNLGVSKTCFVKALLDESGAYKVECSTPIQVELLSARNWETRFSSSYNCIPLFVVDDKDFVFTKEFGEQFNKLDNCYLIIISRVDYRRKNVICATNNSVYEFVADGINHKIIPKINFADTLMSMIKAV